MLWGEAFPSAIRVVREGSLLLAVLGAFLVAAPTLAQGVQRTADTGQQPQESPAPSNGTEQDDPHAGNVGMNVVDMNPASAYLMNLASGTSVNAAAWPMPMVMTHFGSWNTMFMGDGFIVDTQQSGPRGGDKSYSPNWFMASTAHRVGTRGAFQVDLMLRLEPATITRERYPLLFQTGETAYGKPIVDGQHPHNFIMALGFHYVGQRLRGRQARFVEASPFHPPLLKLTAEEEAQMKEMNPKSPDEISCLELVDYVGGTKGNSNPFLDHCRTAASARTWARRRSDCDERPPVFNSALLSPRQSHVFGDEQRDFDLSGSGQFLILHRSRGAARLIAPQGNGNIPVCSQHHILQSYAPRGIWGTSSADLSHHSRRHFAGPCQHSTPLRQLLG
jgi:hypothetical protein